MLHFKISDGDIEDVNGWAFTTKTGLYGTDYLQRALVTAIGLGANRPQDAVYPTSRRRTRDGKPYDGANKYVMHFDKGQTPPVQGLLVADDVRRATTSSSPTRSTATRSAPRQDLKANADGSVDLYIQNESPGRGQGVELAAGADGQVHPDAAALLAGRKRPSILDGSWVDPAGQARKLRRTKVTRRILAAAAAIVAMQAVGGVAHAQQFLTKTKYYIGTLNCNVSGSVGLIFGSSKDLTACS